VRHSSGPVPAHSGEPAQQVTDLLIFAYYFRPLNESGAHRPFRFARYLTPLGIRSHVVTASDPGSTPAWSSSAYVEDPGGRHWSEVDNWTRLGKLVQRVLPYNDRLDWTPAACRAGESIIRQTRATAVLSTSPPIASHFVARYLKHRHGIRWIADIRDPISHNPFRTGLIANWYDAAVERMVIEGADAVIANTDTAGQLLRKRYPRFAEKIHVIWNGYDSQDGLGPMPLSRPDCNVLLHAGSLYGGRHPGMLVRSLERLIRAGRISPTAVRLDLIGSIERQHPWVTECGLEELCSQQWLRCVEGMLPVSEAHAAMASAASLLLLDLNEQRASLQVPGKLFEYIQIGRPILAFTTPGSPSERILQQSGIPHVCIYQDASDHETDDRVIRFLSLPSNPVPPSAWFREQFDGSLQARTLAELIRGPSATHF